MSAISNLWYVCIADYDATMPNFYGQVYSFTNELECKSFAKSIMVNINRPGIYAYCWNYYGGFGYFDLTGVFVPKPIQYWP